MRRGILIRVVSLLALLAALIAAVASSSGGRSASGVRETYFEQFFTSGGPIVWFILLPMSLIMVYLAIDYSLTIRRKTLLPAGTVEEIADIAGRTGAEKLPVVLGGRGDLVGAAISKAAASCGGDWFRLRNAVFESLQGQATALFRRIEWLNLIGNVSPMVGLFGTVVGMIMLFNQMVIAGGQPQPVQLADGISVALVTTFWGLLIAIPALAVYGVFRNRIETLANEAVDEAERLLPHLKVSTKQPVAAERSAGRNIEEIRPKSASPGQQAASRVQERKV